MTPGPTGALTRSLARPAAPAVPARTVTSPSETAPRHGALSEVNPDRPLVVFAVVLLGLLLAYLGVRALSAQEGTRLLNGAGPLSLLAASLWTAYVLTARSPRLIWTPVPWLGS